MTEMTEFLVQRLYLAAIVLSLLLLGSCATPKVSFSEGDYLGRPHILVQTETLKYYYDIRGGGFSRIIDQEGNDWVSFKMEPWGAYPASAASAFRGLPNLVFQGEDDGAGHPGHDQCTSRVEKGKIITETLSGKWIWTWEFRNDHAILEIQKADPRRPYWFLYEGTPGGSYDPGSSYFGSDQGGPFPGAHDYYKGDILWGSFRWIYAGRSDAPGVFYMVQQQEDDLMDMISFLGSTETGLESPDGMTVFGFGREKEARPLLTGEHTFIIGLFHQKIESKTAHEDLSRYIKKQCLK